MALRNLDDRDSSIQYSGGWDTSGHPTEEFQGTTTYTSTAGATARVTFTGTGISVFGTIARTGGGASGPVSTYLIEGDSSTQKRFQGSPTDAIQYRVNFYEIRNLAFGRHVLVIRYEADSDMQLFLDYLTVVGQTEQSPPPTPNPPVVNPSPDPPPISSPSPPPSPLPPTVSSRPDPEPSSNSAGQSLSGSPTSLSNSGTSSGTPSPESHGPSGPSHSLILPPGVSAPAGDQNSLPTSGSSESSHREGGNSGIRLDAIIGGTIGGVAVMCTLFLILVLCMRRRQRKRYGGIGGLLPEMQNISLEPRNSPAYEKAALAGDATPLGVYSAQTSPSQHSSSLPLSSSIEPNQERLRVTPTYANYSQESTSSDALHIQSNPLGTPPTQADTSRLSMGPPPQYQPRA